jgi:hypothetical protein
MSYVAAIVGFIVGFGGATFLFAEFLPYQWWLDFRERYSFAMPAMCAIQFVTGLAVGAAAFWFFR